MNIYKGTAKAVGVGMILGVCGCGSVVTSRLESEALGLGKTPAKAIEGKSYCLPKGKVQIDITWNKDEAAWVVKIGTVFVPDGKPYFLEIDKNPLFDVTGLKLAVNPDTLLLQTVAASSEDKTGAIAGSLASIAASVLTFGTSLAAGGINPLGVKATSAPVLHAYHTQIVPGDEVIDFSTPELRPASSVETVKKEETAKSATVTTTTTWTNAPAVRFNIKIEPSDLDDRNGLQNLNANDPNNGANLGQQWRESGTRIRQAYRRCRIPTASPL
jgi:hypothetical protein